MIKMTDSTFTGWRRSRRSGNGGNCVEIATAPGAVAMRDSKDPTGPVLVFDTDSWSAFLAAAKHGEFDR